MTLPPTAGDTLGPYVLQRVLGEGSFGVVWLAEDTVTSQKTALKISNKDAAKNNADYARNEAKVMRAVSHKSNLAALNFFETEHHCVLAMPFIEGGDMLVWLREQRRLPEATARRLFAQVCSGIEHAHKAGFVHRDIKLENLLLDTEAERVYIADWGFGGPWHADVLQNKALGSLHYSAPEICRGSYYIGPEVDVWSLGVVLYALVSGRLPFRADKNHTTCEEILIANPRFPSDLSPELVALIKRMLEPDRSLRITMAGVLADEWMTSGSCVRRTSAPSILGRDSPAAAPSPTPSRPSTPSPKSSHGPRNNSAETMRREDKRERDASRSVTPLPSPDLERLCTASPPPSPTRFLAKYLPFFAHRDNKHRHSVSTANSNANANANTTTAAAPTAC